jgi:hypothetical protein
MIFGGLFVDAEGTAPLSAFSFKRYFATGYY